MFTFCVKDINNVARQLHFTFQEAVVAEWLRRLTRNQFPSGSAGSNPADCELTFYESGFDVMNLI